MMDLNEVKAEIQTICRGSSKMVLHNDPFGHPVLLSIGCLPEDPDCQVVTYPPEVEEKDIGQTKQVQISGYSRSLARRRRLLYTNLNRTVINQDESS